MSSITLNVAKRSTGKRASKDVRNEGKVPGVYYVGKEEPVAISSDILALRPVIYTAQAKTIDLVIDGQQVSRKCIVKDVRFHPVTDEIVHFDLMGLQEDKKVLVNLPINLTGTSVGVRSGGVMQHVLKRIKAKVLPKDLVEYIEVDVSGLDINKTIRLDEIRRPEIEFMIKDNAVICHVVPPRVKKA